MLVVPGGKSVYLWAGKGANEPELALGKKLMERFGPNADVKQVVEEEQEP